MHSDSSVSLTRRNYLSACSVMATGFLSVLAGCMGGSESESPSSTLNREPTARSTATAIPTQSETENNELYSGTFTDTPNKTTRPPAYRSPTPRSRPPPTQTTTPTTPQTETPTKTEQNTTDRTSELVPQKVYRIENVHSGKVMEVNNSSTESGGDIVQREWNNTANQMWRPRAKGDGTFLFQNLNSSLLLSPTNGGKKGSPLHQWRQTGYTGQQWYTVANGDDSHRIVNYRRGFVINVKGTSTKNGANITLWPWSVGHPSRKWKLSRVTI